MQKAFETELVYIGKNGANAKVTLTLYTSSSLLLIQLTEKAGCNGLSVTDGFQSLMSLVESAYPQHFENGKPVMWVEHYEEQNTRHVVTIQNGTPHWKHITTAEFDDIIGKIDQKSCNHPSFECRSRVFRQTPDGTDPADPTIKPDGFTLLSEVFCGVCGCEFSFKNLHPSQLSPNGTSLILEMQPGRTIPIAVHSKPVVTLREEMTANAHHN